MTQQQPTPLTRYLPKSFARPEQPLQEALDAARTSMRIFQAWLADLPEAVLSVPTTPGKWSPVEHADHLVKTNQVFAALMDIAARDEALPELGVGYVYPDGRLVTLSAMEPTSERSRDELLTDLQDSAFQVEAAALRLQDLGKQETPCIPGWIFAPMNVREATQLLGAHYRRHMPRVENRA
ncbi:DinB family protein [Deinococcus pimensis]|uniref:DinB family protein n=1 Tax=Deinococcus pimensis TaxID=309888 RepID=UPI000489BAE3|nr:DinB family protein [Deinococcus pimensis]